MNYLLVIFVKILSYLPFKILRLIALKIYLINILFKYRYKTISKNLKTVFPEKSELEIKKIRRSFYKYFFNLIIEIIKMISVKKSFINKRVRIINPEVINNLIKKRKGVILLSGHYNNWEWMGAKIALSFDQSFIAIYKNLNSAVFNKLLINCRERFSGKVISMEESIRYLLETKNDPQIIGIIADQNPVINKNTRWLTFFGKEIPVFIGPEKIAKKMNYPVIFCNMEKKNKEDYSVEFKIIEENPKTCIEGEITKRYFKRLEEQIKRQPSQWLWTHKRWKHKK